MLRCLAPLLSFGLLLLPGCGTAEEADAEIVLYTSVDEPIARQVIAAFEARTGHRVRLVTDTEATRSVGLAERLRAERDRPRADVWWGNEPFYTIGLAEDGLLQPRDWITATDVGEIYRDPEGRWVGNGLRARVIAISAPGGAPARSVARLEDLLDPALRGQITMARPTAGTTGGHVAALYAVWGEERADAFFRGLRDNGIRLVAGNSHVAQQVGAGTFLAGLTDNDDIVAAGAAGGALAEVLPDQAEGEIGTLTIPTTVGLVAGRRPTETTAALADFLASADAEQVLVEAGFVAYSVRQPPESGGVRPMRVDYALVAATLGDRIRRTLDLLEGR